MATPAANEAYALKGMEHIKKAVTGNGFAPEHVILKNFNPAVLHFQATTQIDVTVATARSIEEGRITSGTVVINEAKAHEQIEKEFDKARNEEDIAKKIKDFFMAQKDQGFALVSRKTTLPFWQKKYVAHVKCSSCRGEGDNGCSRCKGTGRVPCNRCHGSRQTVCSACNGGQWIRDGNAGAKRPCPTCSGRGKVSCSTCGSSGQVRCGACGSRGAITCKACKGKGWSSHVFEGRLEASTQFEFARNDIPEKIAKLIDSEKNTLAEHVSFKPATEPFKTPNTAEKVFHLPLRYNVVLPYCDIEFDIKGTSYPATVFGMQGSIRQSGMFLDDLLAPAVKALEDSVKTPERMMAHLKDAADYRAARQTLLLSARYTPAKAAQMMLAENPIGLSQDKAKRMIALAESAVKIISQAAQVKGLATAQILYVALLGLFFITPLRSMLLTQIGGMVPAPAIDLVFVCLCAYAGFETIKGVGGLQLKRQLQSIMPRQKIPASMKTGTFGFWYFLISIVLFPVVLETGRQFFDRAPEWYVSVLDRLF